MPRAPHHPPTNSDPLPRAVGEAGGGGRSEPLANHRDHAPRPPAPSPFQGDGGRGAGSPRRDDERGARPPHPDPTTLPTLPDLLCPGLDLVIAGINPGERSAAVGHYYGHPGNSFWRRLAASPLVSSAVTSEDDRRLQEPDPETGLRIGFTDVVKRVLTDSSQITREEFEAAIPAFRQRIARAAPRAVCFTGTRQFEAIYPGRWVARGWGRQDVAPLEGAAVWVMPSPSGRAAGHHREIDRVLADLAASLGVRRSARSRGNAPRTGAA